MEYFMPKVSEVFDYEIMSPTFSELKLILFFSISQLFRFLSSLSRSLIELSSVICWDGAYNSIELHSPSNILQIFQKFFTHKL